MSRIVFATDLHLTEGQGGQQAFAEDLHEIDALRPDLLVIGGDICLWETGAGDQVQSLLARHSMPVAWLMGNHDTDRNGSADAFDTDFTSRFGPRNAHIELPHAHVITLNTCRLQPELEGWRNVQAEVCPQDLAWLDATLPGLATDKPLLVFVHIALATTYPERRNADQHTTDIWRVTNADAVMQRLSGWPGQVVVGQGHLHENEHLHRDNVHLVSLGSICGRWWQQGADTRCTDDSPRGWLLVDATPEGIELSYRAARAPASWQGDIVQIGSWRYLNLFFGDPAEPVEILHEGTWQRLPEPQSVPVDDTFFSIHHWQLPQDCTAESVEVRSWMRGQPWVVGPISQR